MARHEALVLRVVGSAWVRNSRLKLSGKGTNREKDQNSELHTQYPQSPRLGEIIFRHYHLYTKNKEADWWFSLSHSSCLNYGCHVP